MKITLIKTFLFTLLMFVVLQLPTQMLLAQQAIVNLEEDDVLPIAPMRYDEAVELPKNVFSSPAGKDLWEKYEDGDLDEKAFIKLQEEYQRLAKQSKDPVVKRNIASHKKNIKKRISKNNSATKKTTIKRKLQAKPSSQGSDEFDEFKEFD